MPLKQVQEKIQQIVYRGEAIWWARLKEEEKRHGFINKIPPSMLQSISSSLLHFLLHLLEWRRHGCLGWIYCQS
jgi:hypothetical protein